jgi:cell division protein FtsN
MEREPSYYEVALTHRQVVVGFVFVLACVLAAFVAGVWIGRDAAPAPATQIAQAAPVEPERAEAQLEKLTFFGERSSAPAPRAASAERKPTPATVPAPATEPEPVVVVDPAAEGMARTLEAEMDSNREPASAAPPPPVAPPGTRVRRAPAPAAETPPAVVAAPAPVEPERATPLAASAAAAPFFIQVYSSTNGARAREIAERLRRSSFEARVLDTPVAGGTTYRVRVGPYANRDLADRTAGRLRREYRLDTWVTDQP